jgi:hypothetical protein
MPNHTMGIGEAQVVSLYLPMAPSPNRVTTTWFLSNVDTDGDV